MEGFEIIGTGGGCEAYHTPLQHGLYVMLTDLDGSRLPVEGEPVLVGMYNEQGHPLTTMQLQTLAEALVLIKYLKRA